MSYWDELASRKAYEAELRAMLSRCQESAVEIATENAALRQIIREALYPVSIYVKDYRGCGMETLVARMRAAIEEERS